MPKQEVFGLCDDTGKAGADGKFGRGTRGRQATGGAVAAFSTPTRAVSEINQSVTGRIKDLCRTGQPGKHVAMGQIHKEADAAEHAAHDPAKGRSSRILLAAFGQALVILIEQLMTLVKFKAYKEKLLQKAKQSKPSAGQVRRSKSNQPERRKAKNVKDIAVPFKRQMMSS